MRTTSSARAGGGFCQRLSVRGRRVAATSHLIFRNCQVQLRDLDMPSLLQASPTFRDSLVCSLYYVVANRSLPEMKNLIRSPVYHPPPLLCQSARLRVSPPGNPPKKGTRKIEASTPRPTGAGTTPRTLRRKSRFLFVYLRSASVARHSGRVPTDFRPLGARTGQGANSARCGGAQR